MMEDTGEDVLRQKPSVVATFFKRSSRVQLFDIWSLSFLLFYILIITDIPNMVRSMDPSYNLEMGIYSGPDSPICASHRFKAGMIHVVFYSVVENITFFGGSRVGTLSRTLWQFITSISFWPF